MIFLVLVVPALIGMEDEMRIIRYYLKCFSSILVTMESTGLSEMV